MSDEEDLKKAINFILSKEMKDFSIERKKDFLLKKLPEHIVTKALDLYPIIETNIDEKIKEIKEKEPNKSFFGSFFDLGILSTVLLSTLGLNYLLDLNRNKKNDIFYKECENKFKEELKKITSEVKQNISEEMEKYQKKDDLSSKITYEIGEYCRKKGLNLNLSSMSTKDKLESVKLDIEKLKTEVKDINVKMENNNMFIKTQIMNEMNTLLEDNNNKLLKSILENQTKLLELVNTSTSITNQRNEMMTTNLQQSVNVIKNQEQKHYIPYKEENKKELIDILQNNKEGELISKKIYEEPEITLKTTNDYESVELVNKNEEKTDSNFEEIFKSILNALEGNKLKNSVLSLMKNQIKTIYENFENINEDTDTITTKPLQNTISLSNNLYKDPKINEKIKQFFKSIGFTEDPNSKVKMMIPKENINSLQEALNFMENN